jgi:hypothetical protein
MKKKAMRKRIKKLEADLSMVKGERDYLRSLYWKDRELHELYVHPKCAESIQKGMNSYVYPVDKDGHQNDAKVYSLFGLEDDTR